MCELRQEAASGRWTTAYGLYRDVYRRCDDGGWRIESRRYSSLARTADDPARPAGAPPDFEVFDVGE